MIAYYHSAPCEVHGIKIPPHGQRHCRISRLAFALSIVLEAGQYPFWQDTLGELMKQGVPALFTILRVLFANAAALYGNSCNAQQKSSRARASLRHTRHPFTAASFRT